MGPSDDPDEQTMVTSGYRYLMIQFKRLATPLLPEEPANRLNAINVEIDNLYSVYDAKAEFDALIPEIEAVLEFADDGAVGSGANRWIVEPGIIARLTEANSSTVDAGTLAKMCREINSSYAYGNILATALLMRTVLNHVPPMFGCETLEGALGSVVARALGSCAAWYRPEAN